MQSFFFFFRQRKHSVSLPKKNMSRLACLVLTCLVAAAQAAPEPVTVRALLWGGGRLGDTARAGVRFFFSRPPRMAGRVAASRVETQGGDAMPCDDYQLVPCL